MALVVIMCARLFGCLALLFGGQHKAPEYQYYPCTCFINQGYLSVPMDKSNPKYSLTIKMTARYTDLGSAGRMAFGSAPHLHPLPLASLSSHSVWEQLQPDSYSDPMRLWRHSKAPLPRRQHEAIPSCQG